MGFALVAAFMTPGERVAGTPDSPESLKFDVRVYTYQGKVQWTAARMYQGQTTNFRTPGGGFAPVYSLPDAQVSREIEVLMTLGAGPNCCEKTCL